MNEAELVFTEMLNCDRMDLYLKKDSPLDKGKSFLISSILKRRVYGEPIQYILGKTEFMGLEFKVAKDVFIPRPETEILVETAIEEAHELISSGANELNIIDIGTGCGCIAISLAKLMSEVNITATDISQEALNLAKENAKTHNVENRIIFLKSDLFDASQMPDMRYAICISNPPYIPTAEIQNLQREVRHEPYLALDGGEDGLSIYRRLVKSSAHYLRRESLLIMEIGFNQLEGLKNIFKNFGEFKILKVVKDYCNIDRVVVAKNIKEYYG